MLITRATPLFRALNATKVVAPITRGYQLDTSYARFPSFNDLPQPEGSWQENHDRKQQKYNAALGASIIGLVLTIAYLKQSGVIFFNWAPPDHYE